MDVNRAEDKHLIRGRRIQDLRDWFSVADFADFADLIVFQADKLVEELDCITVSAGLSAARIPDPLTGAKSRANSITAGILPCVSRSSDAWFPRQRVRFPFLCLYFCALARSIAF